MTETSLTYGNFLKRNKIINKWNRWIIYPNTLLKIVIQNNCWWISCKHHLFVDICKKAVNIYYVSVIRTVWFYWLKEKTDRHDLVSRDFIKDDQTYRSIHAPYIDSIQTLHSFSSFVLIKLLWNRMQLILHMVNTILTSIISCLLHQLIQYSKSCIWAKFIKPMSPYHVMCSTGDRLGDRSDHGSRLNFL